MRDKSKCPFFDEKKGECKLIDITKDLTDINRLLAEIAEAYAPQKIAPSPLPPGLRDETPKGLAEATGLPISVHPLFDFLQGSSDKKKPYWGQEEESKKKQKYWEKELKRMDKEKKEK